MQDELRQERALKERAMRERDAAVSDKFSVEQALQVSLPFIPHNLLITICILLSNTCHISLFKVFRVRVRV